ncbi:MULTISPECIES: DUF1499 domain-containing protein [Pacificibacter]|uniref:DUF1499 domain-containing protein n=1 Tax=Pacificibacter TaxID=1042323 RepID=UPI001C080C60|nr:MULTISPECIES: DUF1499 domain-containing protein [Pacificibacter]MBU2937823.1 DUF1499 domain-containing protein [Pacificibacter marinus]MDO6616084.1 DUF1499 domain-containing protein [Pacificibacter sp. 1_MG-2023]
MKRFVILAVITAVLGLSLMATIFFGARFGLWEPIKGFQLYRSYFNPIGFVILGAGVIAMLVHLVRAERKQAGLGGLICLIGLATLTPWAMGLANPPVRAAPIHDISTDMVNVPQFEVIDETRVGASNTLVYGGADVAATQAKSYPDIAPLLTDLSPVAAFERALDVAADMGWNIVASDDVRLRFEAVARTPVFYFADDVVVVVTPEGETSRVDMRGVSRIGRSDQGVNAARIRSFQSAFADKG